MKLGLSRKRTMLVATTAVLALGLAACSSGGANTSGTASNAGGGGKVATTKRLTIAMVTHESPGDSFWDKIRAGAQAAAAKDNVDLKYSNDPDATKQAGLIQAAIASKVDGIATTLATPAALASSVKAALAAGIPTIAFNSGIDQYKSTGALMYFGSDEDLAGLTAGKRITAEGGKKVLCVIQAQGSVALEARCAGVKKGAPATENVNVNGTDIASTTATISAKLQQDPSIDYVVTLGAPIAMAALTSLYAGQQQGQDRHLRPQRRCGQGDPGRQDRLLDRPAALPTGLRSRGLAVAVPDQPQRHRRRPPGAHRPVLRRQVQHRRHRTVRGKEHTLNPSGGSGRPLPRDLQPSEPIMSRVLSTEPPTPAATGKDTPRPPRPSLLHTVLARPEIGALIAAVAIFIFFCVVAPPFRNLASLANVLYQSSTIGIVAAGVALLMIGGEFDLSAGVSSTTAALTASMFSYQLGINLWIGAIVALAVALVIGFVNGYLVVRTGIPSFLVTLSTFFILQGLNLGVTKMVTGTVATVDISSMDGFSSLQALFAAGLTVGGVTISITVLWWAFFVALATWILLRTKVGNWIFAVGGNAASARAVGVPVARVKIGLFMGVSFLAWFYGMHTLYGYNTVQSGQGVGNEFLYIIAAVVGGTLLTGGYGSAIGAAIGAFIFGMTTQGIVYAGWDPNWFKAFLGVMLLLAVLVNLYVKKLSSTRK